MYVGLSQISDGVSSAVVAQDDRDQHRVTPILPSPTFAQKTRPNGNGGALSAGIYIECLSSRILFSTFQRTRR